ncbi:amino acid ABC transporter ATP-binding protein [Paludibacterium yongneupense]|uniref:amino acid ABC transporter ATP-binding protein n=1 Tax=Paludibacterium yongneupense TaxID=400061 RepID=UPI00041812B3|nr:amino acid ABC transporter ATP-binding protein [Paludibacterium yongneupense]
MIRLGKLEKRFGDQLVLADIDIEIAEGGVTALIGPSGSGKSTLLRCVNLLEMPQRGSLRLGEEVLEFRPGTAPSRAGVHAMRLASGMVFQNFQLFPHRTVVENVMESLLTVHRWQREPARERALALLDKVGMRHKADAWPATLSGGQQQRVAIARALAPSPRVLLCDEPTSALDPELAGEVVDVLAQLAREGMTMLMATHDLRLAAAIAHEVVFLDGGRVVEAGTARDIFTRPRQARTAAFVASLSETLPESWSI